MLKRPDKPEAIEYIETSLRALGVNPLWVEDFTHIPEQLQSLYESTHIFCYGLPGSGKSTHLESYRRDGYLVFDDFMKNATDHNPAFQYSRHFEDIVAALQSSKACVIADIRLCEREYRKQVVRILRERLPDLSFSWRCFDCRTVEAVETCRGNVRYRAEVTRRHSDHALQAIDEFSPLFSVEDGALIHPVVHARQVSEK